MLNEKQNLEWGKFWARIVGGLGLAATGTIAAHAVADEAVSIEWGGVGALIGMATAFGFMLSKFRRGDELDRAIDRVTSVHAGLATIGLMMAQTLLSQIGWLGSEPIPVFAMPGFFILYKTIIAQYLRASLAEGKDTAGVASLRP